MTVLAMCESGGGQAWGYLIPILAVAIWGLIVFAVFRRSDPADRPWLVGLLIGSMAVGAAILYFPDGFDGRGHYLGRFFVSVAVSFALALLIAVARGRAHLRTIGAAMVGNVFLPGLLILLLIWIFVGTGACLD